MQQPFKWANRAIVSLNNILTLQVDRAAYCGKMANPLNTRSALISTSQSDQYNIPIITNLYQNNYILEVEGNNNLCGQVVGVTGIGTISDSARVNVLLMDCSSSMRTNDPNDLRIPAAKSFVDNLGPNDYLIFATFGLSNSPPFSQVHADGVCTYAFKNQVKNLIDQYASNDSGSHTPLYVSLAESIENASAIGQWIGNQLDIPVTTNIIAFTDGQDTFNPGTSLRNQPANVRDLYTLFDNYELVILSALSNLTTIHNIGLGNSLDIEILNEISTMTRGMFACCDSATELSGIFNQFAYAIRGQILTEVLFNRDVNDYLCTNTRFNLFIQGGKYVQGSF